MFSVVLANQKGGVGKTTNAINIAGALAHRGHEVLLADFDPQGYLTLTLGLERGRRDASVRLIDAFREPSRIDPRDLVRDHPEFGVVTADESLREVTRTFERDDESRVGTAERALREIADDRYDVVVIDTPPVQNAFTDALLADVRDVFVPMLSSEHSVHSIRSLVDRVVDIERSTQAGIRIRAVMLSNVSYPLDNEQKRVKRWVDDNFGDQCPVYEIRRRAAIQRSLKAHGSIFGADAEPTDMQAVYSKVAAQIEGLHPDIRPARSDDGASKQ